MAKYKELGQYPAILTSHLVNNAYTLLRENLGIRSSYTPLLIGAIKTHSSPKDESPESELLEQYWVCECIDIATNNPPTTANPVQPLSLVWTAPIKRKSSSTIQDCLFLLLLFSRRTINSSSSSLLFASCLDGCSCEVHVYRMYSLWASVVTSSDFSSFE